MTEGHHILVEPNDLIRGESIGKGAFATVYKAKMKKTTEEVCMFVYQLHAGSNSFTSASLEHWHDQRSRYYYKNHI